MQENLNSNKNSEVKESFLDRIDYQVDGYEDLLDPRNTMKPEHRELYEIEKRKHFTEGADAFQTLLKKDPSQLLHPEKTRIVVLLRAQGFTISEICRQVQWSKPTVLKTIREFASKISKLKRVELEELLQTYNLTLKKRIHNYGIILGTLLAELETRDLKDVTSDKLIDLILKCNKAISEDILSKIIAESESVEKIPEAGLL